MDYNAIVNLPKTKFELSVTLHSSVKTHTGLTQSNLWRIKKSRLTLKSSLYQKLSVQ